MAVPPTARPLRASVSGSFQRALDEVYRVVQDLRGAKVEVLSPADPRPVEQFHDFVYVASDIERTVRILQERHFAAIERSDLLWVCVPDGRLGASTAAEIHHAKTHGIPVFSRDVPDDIYWRQLLIAATTVDDALQLIRRGWSERPTTPPLSFLLEPHATADQVHDIADRLRSRLTAGRTPSADDPETWRLLNSLRKLASRTSEP